MRVFDQLGYAGTAVKTRKARAGLTTLGITIGIAAIVALLSLSNGFSAAINTQFTKGFATDTLTVTARGGGGGFFGGGGSTSSSGFQLNVSDADVIKSLSSQTSIAITLAVPIAEKVCNYTLGGVNYSAEVVGVNFAQYNALFNLTFVNNASVNSFIPVNDPTNTTFVIGARVAQNEDGTVNFKIGDPMSLTYYNSTTVYTPSPHVVYTVLNSTTSTVGAILPLIGGFNLGGPSDSAVYMQIDNALPFFNSSAVSSIIVQLGTPDSPPTAADIANVTAVIENYYNNLVSVTSGTAIENTINSVFSIIDVFIGAIAGISLIVAGIGIMNIQIVAILERTREIGILKAMGAKDRTVLSVFLTETLFIGLLGAGLGILAGWLLAIVAGSIIGGLASSGGGFGGFGGGAAARTAASSGLSIAPVLTPELVLLAVLFGVLVAVVFGLYPALRASRLKPVDALRYE